MDQGENKQLTEVKLSKKKRIFMFFKKRKKRIILLLFLIVAACGGVFYYKNRPTKELEQVYVYTEPTKASLIGSIVSVYDGDTELTPGISIYNRIIKVTTSLEVDRYQDINLTDKSQVKLVSNGTSYNPINFETIIIKSEPGTFNFYFELNRDYTPEMIVFVDEAIENNLEILINSSAKYYSINKELNMVFDDETNEEYLELTSTLQKFVNNPMELSTYNLPEIDLVMNTTNNNKISFVDTEKKEPASSSSGHPSYYRKCNGIDSSTLSPTTIEVSCRVYDIEYKLETSSRLVGITRSMNIYHNSYPQDLVGTLDSHDDLNKQTLSIAGSSREIVQIKDSYSEKYYSIFKIDPNNVYVLTTSKSNYHQIPTEIIELEKKLLFKVIESINYLDQESQIAVKENELSKPETDDEQNIVETENFEEAKESELNLDN